MARYARRDSIARGATQRREARLNGATRKKWRDSQRGNFQQVLVWFSFNFALSPIYSLSNALLERTNHVSHALGDKQDETGNFYEINADMVLSAVWKITCLGGGGGGLNTRHKRQTFFTITYFNQMVFAAVVALPSCLLKVPTLYYQQRGYRSGGDTIHWRVRGDTFSGGGGGQYPL